MSKSDRKPTPIFVSYSHQDKKWLERLQVHLKPLVRAGDIELWDDTRIQPGADWKTEIDRALVSARVAVLLVSADFLASDFIHDEELPVLLQAAQKRGTRILPVILSYCLYTDSLLGRFQAVNAPDRPLEQLAKAGWDKALSDLARAIAAGLSPDSPTEATTPKETTAGGVPIGVTLKSVALWTTYVGAVAALVIAYNQFGQELGTTSHLTILALGGLPLLVTIVTHSLPTWWDNRRKRRVEDYGRHGQLKKPRYFRLTPYETEDRDSFNRSDLAHKYVYDWIRRSTAPVLYLSGASGTGKTSLLNAWVLPELQGNEPRFVTVVIRSFDDPVTALVDVLTRPGTIWKSRPPSDATPRVLLDKACEYIRGKSLLIILDQFEEFLTLHDADSRRELQQLLTSLSQTPIPGLTILLSLRSEYLGQLDDEGLPPIAKGTTWMEISPFNLRMSQRFLDESGLHLDPILRYHVLTEATTVEGTQGLIRPITLNLFGLILDRFSGRLPQDVAPGSLLINYVRGALEEPDIKAEAPDIVLEMIGSGGTRTPQSEQALAQATGHGHELVRGALLSLANKGIVRRLDTNTHIWEVSHDFIAGLLGEILLKSKITTIGHLRLAWLAPTVVSLWFIGFFVARPFYVEWHNQTFEVSAIADKAREIEAMYGELYNEIIQPRFARAPVLSHAFELRVGDSYRAIKFFADVNDRGRLHCDAAFPNNQTNAYVVITVNNREQPLATLEARSSNLKDQVIYSFRVHDLTNWYANGVIDNTPNIHELNFELLVPQPTEDTIGDKSVQISCIMILENRVEKDVEEGEPVF